MAATPARRRGRARIRAEAGNGVRALTAAAILVGAATQGNAAPLGYPRRALGGSDGYDNTDTSDYELAPGGLAEQYLPDCSVETDGTVTTNGTIACSVMIRGADETMHRKVDSVDGFYVVTSCYNGRPMYTRDDDAEGARVMWFSDYYGDWSISEGLEPPKREQQRLWPVLAWGGEGSFDLRPQLVTPMSWYVNASLSKLPNPNDEGWLLATSVEVECDDIDDELVGQESQRPQDLRGNANTNGEIDLGTASPPPPRQGTGVLAGKDSKPVVTGGAGAGEFRGPILGMIIVAGTLIVIVVPLRTYLIDSEAHERRSGTALDRNVREAEMTRLVKGDDAR